MMKYHAQMTVENVADVVPEVVKWNSWDAEHLRVVHKAYDAPDFLLSIPDTVVFVDKIRLPIIGLKIKVMAVAHQWDDLTQVSYTLSPFMLAKNTISIIPLEAKKSLVRVKYEFSGNWFQSLLFPVITRLMKRWNETVWKEDLPVKLRRQKALEYGFVDWRGLPDRLEDRVDRSLTYKCEIPVRKTRNIQEENNPLSLTKNEQISNS